MTRWCAQMLRAYLAQVQASMARGAREPRSATEHGGGSKQMTAGEGEGLRVRAESHGPGAVHLSGLGGSGSGDAPQAGKAGINGGRAERGQGQEREEIGVGRSDGCPDVALLPAHWLSVEGNPRAIKAGLAGGECLSFADHLASL